MVADGEGKAHGEARRGRLWARLVAHAQATESGAGSPGQPPSGLRELGLDRTRDGLLYIPAGYRDDRPAPLVLMLHGASGGAHHGLNPLLAHADEAGLILLAPDSRGPTWDVIRRGYGPDITYIDRALEQTFARYAVDRTRIAIEGFSDGASYALSVGLTNGDLFTHVIAFSPGFMVPADHRGKPRVFISHGLHDEVLPIDRCSSRIALQLERAGYDLTYREFDGPHTVPPAIAVAALAWYMGQDSHDGPSLPRPDTR